MRDIALFVGGLWFGWWAGMITALFCGIASASPEAEGRFLVVGEDARG